MKIMLRDGLEYEGTPLEIVKAMKGMAFDCGRMSVSEYVDWAAGNVKKFELVTIDVGGDTEVAKAEALVKAMLAHDLCMEV